MPAARTTGLPARYQLFIYHVGGETVGDAGGRDRR